MEVGGLLLYTLISGAVSLCKLRACVNHAVVRAALAGIVAGEGLRRLLHQLAHWDGV